IRRSMEHRDRAYPEHHPRPPQLIEAAVAGCRKLGQKRSCPKFAPNERFSNGLARALEDISFLRTSRGRAFWVRAPVIADKGEVSDTFWSGLLQHPKIKIE